MKAGRTSLLSRLFTGLLLAAGVSILAFGIGFRLADLHVQTVLTGSMRPTVAPGDLAITQGVTTGSLRVGDVIAFTPPNGTQPVLHRIATREGDVITTKGDANSTADPWHAMLQGTTSYRLVFVVPSIGSLTELQRPVLLLACLLGGLALLLALRKEVRGRTTKPQPETRI